METINRDSTVQEIINDKDFGDFGRLLFPIDRHIDKNMTLEELTSSHVYIWYSYLQVSKTIEIINELKKRSKKETIFLDIYSEQEKIKDPSKNNTGLFFLKGKKNAPYAIVNAGGGFMYVAVMHDSLPHALEISKKEYNAFALVYRPNHAYEDLARAIAYIYDHADVLEVDKNQYSLWGGSAGARMAAQLGMKNAMTYFGRSDIPSCQSIIMQYTGYTKVSKRDAPSYACVGTHDSIADYHIMQERSKYLNSIHIPSICHVYKGLSHGFGLGIGTIAEGWINEAIEFWEKNMK